jgi:hypothetical protein
MGHDDFIVSARTAVEEVGGRFDQNVSLVPSRDRRWNEAATVSPK